MSKKFQEINWDKTLYKRAVKDYNKLAVLYADVLLSREAWEKEAYMWMDKYYKLLKRNKKLKKELKMCEARWESVEPPVRLSNAVEDVLKKEWDTPEEDKAWEGLLDSSNEVKE